jgi:hypothetical protein
MRMYVFLTLERVVASSGLFLEAFPVIDETGVPQARCCVLPRARQNADTGSAGKIINFQIVCSLSMTLSLSCFYRPRIVLALELDRRSQVSYSDSCSRNYSFHYHAGPRPRLPLRVPPK